MATIEIDGHDYKQIDNAIKIFKNLINQLNSCKTVIGYGSPNKSGKSSCVDLLLVNQNQKLPKN